MCVHHVQVPVGAPMHVPTSLVLVLRAILLATCSIDIMYLEPPRYQSMHYIAWLHVHVAIYYTRYGTGI